MGKIHKEPMATDRLNQARKMAYRYLDDGDRYMNHAGRWLGDCVREIERLRELSRDRQDEIRGLNRIIEKLTRILDEQ